MKPLQLFSDISELPFGLATQLKLGDPLVVDYDVTLQSYDRVMQAAFKGENNNILVLYAGIRDNSYSIDFMANISYLYNIVYQNMGPNFNEDSILNQFHEFASACLKTDEENGYITCLEDSIMFVKNYPAGLFDSPEDVFLAMIKILDVYIRNIYKDVIISLPLSNEEREYIYDVLGSIDHNRS